MEKNINCTKQFSEPYEQSGKGNIRLVKDIERKKNGGQRVMIEEAVNAKLLETEFQLIKTKEQLAKTKEQLRQFEVQLTATNDQLSKIEEQFVKTKQNRQKYLQNISQHIGSPLAIIQEYVQALLDDIDKKEERKYFQEKRLYTVQRFIQQLYELARLEAGELPFHKQQIPVHHLFLHLVQRIESDIQQDGLHCKWDICYEKEEKFPLVEVDIRRLEQGIGHIISCLVTNNKQGEIGFRLKIEGKKAVFSVEGEERNLQGNFPLAFKQWDGKTDTLGLFICKEIIIHHLGEIWLHRKNDRITIQFSLPISFTSFLKD